MSVVLKPFHVKDPQNDMYLATAHGPPEAKFELQMFANTYIQRFAHIFTTFQK